jgi:hypothetical protein
MTDPFDFGNALIITPALQGPPGTPATGVTGPAGSMFLGNGTSPAGFGGQTADLQNFDQKNIRTLDYDQKLANGSSGSAITIAWANGGVQSVVLSASAPTLTMTAPIGVSKLTLFVLQDATGGRAPTFSPAPKWTGGSAPSFSSAANAVDIVSLIYDGTSYYAIMSPNFA